MVRTHQVEGLRYDDLDPASTVYGPFCEDSPFLPFRFSKADLVALAESAGGDARTAAFEITDGLSEFESMPTWSQVWLTSTVAYGPEGVTELAAALVYGSHTRQTRDKPSEFKLQVMAVLEAGVTKFDERAYELAAKLSMNMSRPGAHALARI